MTDLLREYWLAHANVVLAAGAVLLAVFSFGLAVGTATAGKS